VTRLERFRHKYVAFTLAFSFGPWVGAGPGIIVWGVTGSVRLGTVLAVIGAVLSLIPSYKFARFIIRQSN
jgi:hypothetical protein